MQGTPSSLRSLTVVIFCRAGQIVRDLDSGHKWIPEQHRPGSTLKLQLILLDRVLLMYNKPDWFAGSCRNLTMVCFIAFLRAREDNYYVTQLSQLKNKNQGQMNKDLSAVIMKNCNFFRFSEHTTFQILTKDFVMCKSVTG